jgi:hypothetical protein
MNESRLILEMLQEGKISIDEAERLLAALRAADPSTGEPEGSSRRSEGPWVELGSVIGACVDDEMHHLRHHLRRIKDEVRNAQIRAREEARRARYEARRECGRAREQAREEWRRGMRFVWHFGEDQDRD